MDGKDVNGLKLEKIGPNFSSFDVVFSKITKNVITVSSSSYNLFDIFLTVLQKHFMWLKALINDFSTELT